MIKNSSDLTLTDEDEYPSFEEISNSESPYFDRQWFESELLPVDHEWAEVIGDFLFMRATVRRYEYTGRNKLLSQENDKHLNKFKDLIPEIEHFIRHSIDGLEFARLWAEFYCAYHSLSFVKREEKSRATRGKFDRGTEAHKAWYAAVYVRERAKGKKGATIKYDIAKYAELIKAGKIKPPQLWTEMQFNKILHDKSTLTGPRLNTTLDEEMNIKKDIPYYAEEVFPTLKLPPLEIKTPGE